MVSFAEKSYRVLGLMSGTSLDGLDMALCRFSKKPNDAWGFTIEKAATIGYSMEMKKLLIGAYYLTAAKLVELDHFYGRWLGSQVNDFLADIPVPDLIASHGHTIYHQPAKGFSLQIGNGNDIAALTGVAVVYDFRSLDIALGGQGAPLVPTGDSLLFGEYDFCLNLGGFSNISYKEGNNRVAFDICPVNIALNEIASRTGKSFDQNGTTGKNGRVLDGLLAELNNLEYYRQSAPKSLGREWYENEFGKLLITKEKPADLLRTIYEHIAMQVSMVVNQRENQKILVTGGGAKNAFLMDCIREKTIHHVKIPDELIIDFKEAVVFALLGLLRHKNLINCFSSATGARRDSSTGVIVTLGDKTLHS